MLMSLLSSSILVLSLGAASNCADRLTAEEDALLTRVYQASEVGGCLVGEINYLIMKEELGFSYNDLDRAALHYSAYICGQITLDKQTTYKYGRRLAFDLKYWGDAIDCRPIRDAAIILDKEDLLNEELSETNTLCADEYMID